jgi:hypothetical protein
VPGAIGGRPRACYGPDPPFARLPRRQTALTDPRPTGELVMKLRSCVLASALVIVPLVAMFSHLVPAGVRRMARVGLWLPVEQAARALVGGEAEPEWSGVIADGRESPLQPRAADVATSPLPPPTVAPGKLPPPSAAMPTATAMSTETDRSGAPSIAGQTGPSGTVNPSAPPAMPVAAVERVSFEASPPAGGAAAPTSAVPPARRSASPDEVAAALVASTRGEWTGHVRGDAPPGGPATAVPPPTTAAGRSTAGAAPSGPPGIDPTTAGARTAVERQLVALGAIGFEFVAADAGSPRHRCSCRLPADPSGQLQRVFQAADEDPRAALDQLLAEVRAWQRRSIALTPAAAPPTSIDGVRR